MRLAFFLTVLTFVLSPLWAYAAYQFDTEVEQIREFPAGSPRFLTVDEAEGRIYTTQSDGTVRVFDLDGQTVMTIKERASDGTRVLRYPTGIAIYQDRIYVADEGLSAVSIFRKDGSFIESFGSRGRGPKEFSLPQGIRVEQGVVYVADKGNARIQLFGPDGVFIRSFGNVGPENDVLKTPTDIALLPNGDMYVTDPEDRNLKLYGPDFKLKSKAERVAYPFALTLYGDGFLASDSKSNRVTMHNFRGELLFGFGSGTMSRGSQMTESLMGVYLDSKLNLYLADMDAGLVRVYKLKNIDPAGERVYPPPTAVGWVRDIGASVGKICWDERGNSLFAIDYMDDSVVQFKDGKIQKRFKVTGWEPSGLAMDQEGALWVSDRKRNRLLKLGPDGKVVLEVGSPGSSDGRLDEPEDLAISKGGVIYVADSGNNRVQLFNTEGVFIRGLGRGGTSSYFKRPAALALDQEGILYVLDGKRREVLVFSQNGLPLNEFGKDEKNKLMFDEPVDLTSNNEEVFVLDAGLRQVLVFNRRGKYVRRFGAPGSQKGDLKNPSSIDSAGMTRVLISDPGNGRIEELSFVYTPVAPNGAVAESGMREVSIAWDPSPEAYVNHYFVYRGADAKGPYERVAETTMSKHTDSGLEPGVAYYYRVTAAAVDGNESSGSSPVSAEPTKYVPSRPVGVRAEPSEDMVRLTWRESETPYVSGYVVHRRSLDGQIVKAGETDGTEFIDSRLSSNASYTYLVSAISIDGEESPPAEVQTTTLVSAGSPLRLDVLELENVLSNSYRRYEHDGMGRIRLTNTTKTVIAPLTVQYRINEFSDDAVETRVEFLPPGGSAELAIKPVFNGSIREAATNTTASVEITALYVYDGQDMKLTVNRTVDVYEKHYTVWDEDGRIATFITSDDPVIKEFTRSLLEQFGDTSDRLVLGGMFFDALGTAGTTYQPDPKKPYQMASKKDNIIDHVQLPRETLKRKSGDNDDLVSLYTAVLESTGMSTRVMLTPGHMFMMFSIGFISETGEQDLDGRLVQLEGRAWVPVEVTLMGSSFLTAWDKGAEQYHEWEGRGLRIVDPRASWERFEPLAPKPDGWQPPLVFKEHVAQRFPADLRTLVRKGLLLKAGGYADNLKKDPNNVNALLQMGILYAEAGEIIDAAHFFEKALALAPTNAALLNNVANLRFLEENFDEACPLYQKASSHDEQDALVLVNLARCLMRIERYKEAEDAFRKAYELDRSVSKTHRRMSLRLMGGF